jgi:hypothetical protein
MPKRAPVVSSSFSKAGDFSNSAAGVTVTEVGQIRGRVLIGILLSTLAFAFVFWNLIPPTYLTNDDVAIKRDLEGLMAPDGTPTGYAIWPHALLGWMLVWVQRVIPVHGWDFVVAGLLVWSVALVLTAAWSLSVERAGRILAILAMLLVVAPLFEGMQYTISATLAGGAAMLSMMMELPLPAPRRSLLFSSAALLLAGFLVRAEGATVGGLMAVVLLVPLALFDRETRAVRLRWLIVAAAALALTSTTIGLLDDAIYRLSPAWADYRLDWLATRRFLDWGSDLPANVVSALRTQLGWTANDWELLRRFWGIDPSIHSQARLDVLFRTWPLVVDWRTRLEWFAQRAVAGITGTMFLHLLGESTRALAAVALIVIAAANRRVAATAIVTGSLFYAACIAIEITFKELPFRVFAPLQVCFVLAILVACRILNGAPSRLRTVSAATIAAILLAGEARTIGSTALARSRQSNEVDLQVSELLQLHPSLLVLHSDSFPSEFWWRPFHTPAIRLRAIQLGTENHNPYMERFLTRSYRTSLLHAICTDHSILVVGEYDRFEPVTTYMREHFDTVVEWNKAYDGSFRAWRCSPAGEK